MADESWRTMKGKIRNHFYKKWAYETNYRGYRDKELARPRDRRQIAEAEKHAPLPDIDVRDHINRILIASG